MSALRGYFADHADSLDIYEIRTANGGIDYFIKIDGTYSERGAEGMLDYHRSELRRVLKAEGLV